MNKAQDVESAEGHITPVIHRKYQTILFVLFVFMILSPEFVSEKTTLIVLEAVALCIGVATWGLYQGFRFQKIARPLRPFIMTRILQVVTCLLVALVIILTLGDALEQKIPYLVYWSVGIFLCWQFFQIFSLAREAKSKYPDRCEFC